jgi:hypothetical protein
MRRIDLTDEGKARNRERILILDRWVKEFTAEGDDIAAQKAELLACHLESGDLFNATDNRQ